MRPANKPIEHAHKPFTVGLTGGIGSGKSMVAERFAEHGIVVVDADEIAHQLTGPNGAAMPEILAAFGPDMCQIDGALNRSAMRRLVFADNNARKRLEDILHPKIRSECSAQLACIHSPYAILVVPLLIESEAYQTQCDRILVVDCTPELQLQRVMQRNAISAEEALRIMAAQTTRAVRLAAASDVIDNSGELPQLNAQIDILHKHYLLESTKPFTKSW